MSKANRKTLFLILFCLLLLEEPHQSSNAACIHDIVQPRNIQHTTVNYNQVKFDVFNKQRHSKRAVKELYKPMRIFVHYHDLSRELVTHEEVEKLKNVVYRTVSKISNILSGE